MTLGGAVGVVVEGGRYLRSLLGRRMKRGIPGGNVWWDNGVDVVWLKLAQIHLLAAELPPPSSRSGLHTMTASLQRRWPS